MACQLNKRLYACILILACLAHVPFAQQSTAVPIPILYAPSFQSICSEIVLDSTLSVGSGGHLFAYSWGTTSDEAIDIYLSSLNTSVVHIPSAFLTPDRVYHFLLNITNSEQIVTETTLDVGVSSRPLPTMLLAPRRFTVRRSASIKIGGRAYPTGCLVPNTEDRFGYSWIRKNGSVFQLDLNTANSPVMYIPAATLPVGETITFEVQALNQRDPDMRGVGTVDVTVVPSKPFASIGGGSKRVFPLSDVEALVIDASQSRDVDRIGDEELRYTWSCWERNRNQPCFDDVGEQAYLTDSPVLTIPLYELTFGQYEFTLTVQSVHPQGLDSALVGMARVVVLSDTNVPLPAVTITLSTDGGLVQTSDTPEAYTVNSNEELVLVGHADSLDSAENEAALHYQWRVVEGDIALNASVLTEGTTANSSVLTLRPDVLRAGSQFTFRLEVSNEYGTGYSDVSVAVNTPPSAGECYVVSPTVPAAYYGRFTAVCHSFDDDAEQLPLFYRFARVPAKDKQAEPTPLHLGKQFNNRLQFVLPPGKWLILAYVSDALGAETTYLIADAVEATVPPEFEQLSSEEIATVIDTVFLKDALVNTDYDMAVQLIDIAIELLDEQSKKRETGSVDSRLRSSLLDTMLNYVAAERSPDTATRLLGLLGKALNSNTLCDLSLQEVEEPLVELSTALESGVLDRALASRSSSVGDKTFQVLGLMISAYHCIEFDHEEAEEERTMLAQALLSKLRLVGMKTLAAAAPGQRPLQWTAPELVVLAGKWKAQDLTIVAEEAEFGISVEQPPLGTLAYQLILFDRDVFDWSSSSENGTQFFRGSKIANFSIFLEEGDQGLRQYILDENRPTVTLHLPLIVEIANVTQQYNATCEIWNETAQQWDSSAAICEVVRYTDEAVECTCSKLGAFSVRLDYIPPTELPPGRPPTNETAPQFSEEPMGGSSFWTPSQIYLLVGFVVVAVFFIIILGVAARGLSSYRSQQQEVEGESGGLPHRVWTGLSPEEAAAPVVLALEEDSENMPTDESAESDTLRSDELELSEEEEGEGEEGDELNFMGMKRTSTSRLKRMSVKTAGDDGRTREFYGSSSTRRKLEADPLKEAESPTFRRPARPTTSTRTERIPSQQRPTEPSRYTRISSRGAMPSVADRSVVTRSSASTRRLSH